MPAPGETDLERILAGLDVRRRAGVFVYDERPLGTPAPPEALAMIDEGSTVSYVVPAPRGEPVPNQFRAAWLTVTVATSLDAVGLTAVLATALAAAGIPANVLAGRRHDHLLVPVARADEAIAVLRSCARMGSGTVR